MHIYSHWQRCSHVYGAVGVSCFRRVGLIVRIVRCDCILHAFVACSARFLHVHLTLMFNFWLYLC